MGSGAWDEARRAWRRLSARLADREASGLDAEGALDTLSDVGALRRMLDEIELAAVRAARHGGRSWAEIAIRLGVSRQSAWERWRELDETENAELPGASETSAGSALARTARSIGRGAKRGGRQRREDGTVEVPNVIGLAVSDARAMLGEVGLIAVGSNPSKRPKALAADAVGVVTDQVPYAGAHRRPGSLVTLWIDAGGGSAGVREPRRPVPPRSAASAERDLA